MGQVDLTEMYSKGNLWCVGGGGGSSEDNDYMKTHFSQGRTPKHETGSVASSGSIN